MKKRFLATVIALTMTAACLTACGGENNTEDKQQTTTTTTEETTTTATTSETTTTTTSMPNGKAEYKITTIKVTTTKDEGRRPPEVPQDVNPGQWLEDSETTTTTTTTKAATTTKPKTTTTKAKTTTKPKTTTTKAKTTAMPKATTTKATTTKAKVSTTNGYWREDPGITKADLKAAAEYAFAKVKKTAAKYSWTISKTFVNRSTDTQYGIFFIISNPKGPDGEDSLYWLVLKAENQSGKVIVRVTERSITAPKDSSTEYEYYTNSVDVDEFLEYLIIQ